MRRLTAVLMAGIMVLTTLTGSLTAFADTEIDQTAPVIHSIKVLNGDDFDATKGVLMVQVEVTEEGSGLKELSMDFGDMWFRWETFYEDDGQCSEDPILFSGTHTIALHLQNSNPLGSYDLRFVAAKDVNGNLFELFGDEVKNYYGDLPRINVTKSNHKEEWMNLKAFRFLETENIDGRGSIEAEITFDGNIDLHRISLEFLDAGTGQETWADIGTTLGEDGALKPGTHRIKFQLNDKLWKGTMRLYGVTLNWNHHFWVEEGENGCENTSIHIVEGRNPAKAPELRDFTVRNPELTAPDVLVMDFDLEDFGDPVNCIFIRYNTESGRSVEVEGELKKSNGKYTARIPVGPFLGEGKLEMRSMTIRYAINNGQDGYKDNKTYLSRSENPELMAKGDIYLKSGYNITYFGSLGNPKVVEILKNMAAGETAVLDCRNYKNVPKTVFEAIAGRDVTVAFIDNNVQWVFNGKSEKRDKCKKINLKSYIKVVSGEATGFPDDKKVAKLIFQNNGELPGEVEMRINYDYLAEKYKFSKENLKLTYLASGNPVLEDANVDMAEDEYYEYNVDHNSTFVLSKNKAKLGATKVSLGANNLKGVKITWEKKSGNGYYVYRATKKDGKYKKIATIKKNTILSYVDENTSVGKNYYYKVKPYSNKKAFNKTAKMSKPCKAYMKLKAPRLCGIMYSKYKKGVTIEWVHNSAATKYELYRATKADGPYKKIVTTRKTYVTDKTAKKGKNYYYKVKAIYKDGSKMNSDLGKAKGRTDM